MRTKLFVPTFGFALLSGALAAPVMGQSGDPVPFNITESALEGTVACNGGAATAITPVDASTTNVSGSNDSQASNLSGTACGLPLYSIGSADDSTSAQDAASQDGGSGNSSVRVVSLLGGVLTYQNKIGVDSCMVSSAQTAICQETTTIQNVTFAGQSITGIFTSPTTYQAVDVTIQIPGYCDGLALFTGSLTIARTSQQTSGNVSKASAAPLVLNGTLACVGSPLATMQVSLADATDYLVPYDQFTHIDFQWANDAKSLVHDKLIELQDEK